MLISLLWNNDFEAEGTVCSHIVVFWTCFDLSREVESDKSQNAISRYSESCTKLSVGAETQDKNKQRKFNMKSSNKSIEQWQLVNCQAGKPHLRRAKSKPPQPENKDMQGMGLGPWPNKCVCNDEWHCGVPMNHNGNHDMMVASLCPHLVNGSLVHGSNHIWCPTAW